MSEILELLTLRPADATTTGSGEARPIGLVSVNVLQPAGVHTPKLARFGGLVLRHKEANPKGTNSTMLEIAYDRPGGGSLTNSVHGTNGDATVDLHVYGVDMTTAEVSWDPRLTVISMPGELSHVDPVLDAERIFDTQIYVPPMDHLLTKGVVVWVSSETPPIPADLANQYGLPTAQL